MNIQETIISRVYENKFREFFITLKIKPTDITLDQKEACRAACELGTLMTGNLEEFQKEGIAGEHTYVFPHSIVGTAKVAVQKKSETIYQRFKRICIDYSGQDYYDRLKKHLGIKHLAELEVKNSESMVADLIKLQEDWINSKKFMYEFEPNFSELIHRDNAYNLWLELFEKFNNPK